MKDFKSEIKEKLKPLYKDLIDACSLEGDSAFCVQWGSRFPKTRNSGVLFVGKCLNGSSNGFLNANILFGNSKNGLVSGDEHLEWVEECEGNSEGYNTNKSAFWRTIKKISMAIYPEKSDNWYKMVAWSNLYKLSPQAEGNSTEAQKTAQFESCLSILKKEISIMSPKHIVMFTSGWEESFLFFLNKEQRPKPIAKSSWGEYESFLYEINNKFFIVSHHPQGKDEEKHTRAIIRLIEKSLEY
jgi:hypothetical protein